jgi:TPR repeat protein
MNSRGDEPDLLGIEGVQPSNHVGPQNWNTSAMSKRRRLPWRKGTGGHGGWRAPMIWSEIGLVIGGERPRLRSMDSRLQEEMIRPAPKSRLSALHAKADGGDADAQYDLGLRYGTSAGQALDLAQAASWYRKAAEQGHLLAQFNLGVMFGRGQGVPQDAVVAAGWMRKAAEGGDAGGQYEIGAHCHRASLTAPQVNATESRIEAYKWLHLAATQGYKDSLTACQRVALIMSRPEFDEATRRAAAFVARPQVNPQMQ